MPVHEVTRSGEVIGYKYGETGTVYLISEHGRAMAKMKAVKQGAAIRHSQEQRGKRPESGPMVV